LDERIQELARHLRTIEIADPALFSLSSDARNVVYVNLVGNILARFAQFLAEHAESLPSKAYCLDLLAKAIDLAFDKLNRPIIANLLKPIVKQTILDAAGRLYDSIVNPMPVFEGT